MDIIELIKHQHWTPGQLLRWKGSVWETFYELTSFTDTRASGRLLGKKLPKESRWRPQPGNVNQLALFGDWQAVDELPPELNRGLK